MPWGILVDSYKSSSRARILDWRSEDTVDTCGTDSPLLMFQPQCSDPFPEPRFAFPELRFALLSLALPPEKESKELPGSSLVTSGHPTAPPASSAASALLNNDALKPAVPSCHDFFVRQNERGQLPQSAKDPGITDGFKQNRNVCSFSCSCLQLRRKPARNNLVNLQQLQVPVGDTQMHRSSASLLMHTSHLC